MKKAGSFFIAVFLLAIICTTAVSALTDYSGGVTEYMLDDYDISVKAPDQLDELYVGRGKGRRKP